MRLEQDIASDFQMILAINRSHRMNPFFPCPLATSTLGKNPVSWDFSSQKYAIPLQTGMPNKVSSYPPVSKQDPVV